MYRLNRLCHFLNLYIILFPWKHEHTQELVLVSSGLFVYLFKIRISWLRTCSPYIQNHHCPSLLMIPGDFLFSCHTYLYRLKLHHAFTVTSPAWRVASRIFKLRSAMIRRVPTAEKQMLTILWKATDFNPLPPGNDGVYFHNSLGLSGSNAHGRTLRKSYSIIRYMVD